MTQKVGALEAIDIHNLPLLPKENAEFLLRQDCQAKFIHYTKHLI